MAGAQRCSCRHRTEANICNCWTLGLYSSSFEHLGVGRQKLGTFPRIDNRYAFESKSSLDNDHLQACLQ